MARVFVVRATYPRPSKCARCFGKIRYQRDYVMYYKLCGHPWDHDGMAWWCIGCLKDNGYEVES